MILDRPTDQVEARVLEQPISGRLRFLDPTTNFEVPHVGNFSFEIAEIRTAFSMNPPTEMRKPDRLSLENNSQDVQLKKSLDLYPTTNGSASQELTRSM